MTEETMGDVVTLADTQAIDGLLRYHETGGHCGDGSEANLKRVRSVLAKIMGQAMSSRPAPSEASADVVEPFGYWVEQKGAEPALLRKPAYIPEPSELRKITPLYAAPQADASGDVRELPAEEIDRIVKTWARFDTEQVDSRGRETRSRIRQTLAHEAEIAALRGQVNKLTDAYLRCSKDRDETRKLLREAGHWVKYAQDIAFADENVEDAAEFLKRIDAYLTESQTDAD